MEKEIKRRLRDRGYTESDLTREEMDRLKREIMDEKKGLFPLDGVLSSPAILMRKLRGGKK